MYKIFEVDESLRRESIEIGLYYDLYACTTVTMRVLRSLCVYYGHYVNTKVTM